MAKQKRMVEKQKRDEEIAAIKSALDQAEALRQQADAVILTLDKLYLDMVSPPVSEKDDFLAQRTGHKS